MSCGRTCTVWSCILLGKDCFLSIAQLCLSWSKFNKVHDLQVTFTSQRTKTECTRGRGVFHGFLFAGPSLPEYPLFHSPILRSPDTKIMHCMLSGKNKWNTIPHPQPLYVCSTDRQFKTAHHHLVKVAHMDLRCFARSRHTQPLNQLAKYQQNNRIFSTVNLRM